MPARCQALPSSPPPRTFAIAYTPPASTQASRSALKSGVRECPKLPYPYRIAGRGRSGAPVGDRMNILTTVPSWEGYVTCLISTAPASAPPGDGAHTVTSRVRASNR